MRAETPHSVLAVADGVQVLRGGKGEAPHGPDGLQDRQAGVLCDWLGGVFRSLRLVLTRKKGHNLGSCHRRPGPGCSGTVAGVQLS